VTRGTPNLLYTDVEDQLRASVRDLLAERAGWQSVLARCESDQPYDPQLWAALGTGLGAAALAIDGAAGGHGGSWREAAVVAEELGRAVAPTPFLGSAVIATALAQRVAADRLVGALAIGERTAAVAVPFSTAPGSCFPGAISAGDGTLTGVVRNVADAATADRLIVPATGPDGPALYDVEARLVRRQLVSSLDLTRPLVDIRFDATPCTPLAAGHAAHAALDGALTVGAAVLASEQLGVAERCLELTVDYLKVRYQFGRPIGSYQALKHRAADLWAEVSQARAVARYAADCIATDCSDAAVAASLAQAYCSQTAVRAAEECVQLHGGIGFTWEHPAHLYLKRAKADAIALGTAAAHRARLSRLVDLPVNGAPEPHV
jgi:alkylation response protein AidB-like acyl-CoA dehydrogenase